MLKMRYGVDSNGDLVKREPLIVNDFVRKGKLFSLYRDAHFREPVSADFALPTNPNAYCDWILFPAKLPLPDDHPDVLRKLSGDIDPETDAYLADLVKDGEGKWWFLGCGVCVCERNYCDGEYISVGRGYSDFYGRTHLLHFLDCGEMEFISPSGHDYHDDAAFCNIAGQQDWGRMCPKEVFDVAIAFYTKCEELPECTCMSNEMSMWLWYRYGVPVNSTDYRRFERQLSEWKLDRGFENMTVTPVPQEGAFDLSIQYPNFDGIRTTRIYHRLSDQGKNVVLLSSGIVLKKPEVIWDSLESLATECGRFTDRPHWFSSKELCDEYCTKAKALYKTPVPLRPLRRSRDYQESPSLGPERS